MKRIATLLIIAAALLGGCYRPANRVIIVSVPQMKTQDCAARIRDAFKMDRPDKVDGVVNVVPNVEKRTVEVTFESLKLSIKNCQFVIARAGFDADDVPADKVARAALPAECRDDGVEKK